MWAKAHGYVIEWSTNLKYSACHGYKSIYFTGGMERINWSGE